MTAPREETMNRITIALLLMLTAGGTHAATVDNAAGSAGATSDAVSAKASFYQGVWAGIWPTGSDVQIAIGKQKADGTYAVKYAWGAYSQAMREFPAGSLDAVGTESGDAFLVKWRNRQGTAITLQLTREPADAVRARLVRDTPPDRMKNRSTETVLRRK